MNIRFKKENDVGFIEFDQAESKVNLLTGDVLHEFDSILDEVAIIPGLSAVVVISRKANIFIAGADIKEIEQITEASDGEAKSLAGQAVLNKLEDLKMPTIAVVDGVALGGGCELALACTFRLATFNEKVRIGLPEINLGFVPGFGGTYRLPRLVGLTEGLKMILSGKPVDGQKALKIGLVDRLIPQKNMEHSIYAFIADVYDGRISRDKYNRRRSKFSLAGRLFDSAPGRQWIFAQTKKSVLKLTKGFYPAHVNAVSLITKTICAGRDTGLALEAKVFGDLAVTKISKNLVRVFYLSERYKKLTVEGAEHVKPIDIHKCGICGAGIMGGGIAQLLSHKGIWVRLKDVHYAALGQGFNAAAKLFRDLVAKRRLTPAQAQQGMARITATLDYSGFGNADFVIEAVVEKMEVKKKVFKEISAAAGPSAIIATNTSALSVTAMAQETQDPSKVIGFHFFNPVHRMSLVEIIKTPQTSPETIVSTLAFAKRLGKTPILVKDSCGFIVNRILLGYINEAGRIAEECGEMERVDALMTEFGMPMGPFTLSDEVGLDVGVKVLRILEEGLGERFKPVPLFDRVYNDGFLGKKSGRGFYDHSKRRTANPAVTALLTGRPVVAFTAENFLKRMVYLMINEAARCLEEGVVDDPGAIDVGMILGTGFPPFRGGLLRYADDTGLESISGDLERFEQQLKAPRFRPCAYLRDLCGQKKGFYR